MLNCYCLPYSYTSGAQSFRKLWAAPVTNASSFNDITINITTGYGIVFLTAISIDCACYKRVHIVKVCTFFYAFSLDEHFEQPAHRGVHCLSKTNSRLHSQEGQGHSASSRASSEKYTHKLPSLDIKNGKTDVCNEQLTLRALQPLQWINFLGMGRNK